MRAHGVELLAQRKGHQMSKLRVASLCDLWLDGKGGFAFSIIHVIYDGIDSALFQIGRDNGKWWIEFFFGI
jgi:hypothetical protein